MRDSGDQDSVRQIVRTLRRRIVAWQYPPQFPLVEETLAQEFGLSRSPIRQALTHLAAEGLVERLPRRGFRVRQLKMADVEDLYGFRLALEFQVVRALALKGLDAQTHNRLQAPWQDPQALASAPVARLAELDENFHLGLAQAHGNALIVQHLEHINERLFAFRELDFDGNDRIASTCAEHGGILEAIVARDVALACELIERNINSGLGNVEDALVRLVGRSYLSSTHSVSKGVSP